MIISIAMATYNGARYLPEQMQSFIDQTRLPDELVISDDGSVDNTLDIIQMFSKTAPFKVRLYQNKKKLGYAGNFNAAIMQTNGDLVFLSDQDDVWFPEKLAHLTELAQVHPKMLLFMNDAALTDDTLNYVGLTALGQIRSAGLKDKNFVMGCCCAVKRELLDLCMPIPTGVDSHDNWITNFADGLNVKLISNRVLQYYRRHGNNTSQLIVNRTTKAKKADLLKEYFYNVLLPASNDVRCHRINKKRLELEGIRHARTRNHGKFSSLLEMMEEETKATLEMLEKRMKICEEYFPNRFFSSLSFLVRGGYRNAFGFRSAFKDIIYRNKI